MDRQPGLNPVAAFRGAGANDVPFVTQTLACADHLVAEVGEVTAADIGQLDPLELVPDALVGVQIGRIPRQVLQMQPLGRSTLQEVLDRLACVDRRAVPDDQQLARDFAHQHTQEAHYPCRIVGFLPDLHEQPAIQGYTADRREVVARQLGPQDKRLAAWRPSTYRQGQQIEA